MCPCVPGVSRLPSVSFYRYRTVLRHQFLTGIPVPVLTGGIALREMQGMHQALVLLAVSCSAYQGGDQADRWPAPTQTKRIKVQHLSPFVGRHNGGLLVNVTGKGVPSARPLSLV